MSREIYCCGDLNELPKLNNKFSKQKRKLKKSFNEPKRNVNRPKRLNKKEKDCGVINLQPLQQETDPSAIAEEFCNQIYQTLQFDPFDILEVSNTAQLKLLFHQVKQQLKTSTIALIFHQDDPYPELKIFCRKLSNAVAIA